MCFSYFITTVYKVFLLRKMHLSIIYIQHMSKPVNCRGGIYKFSVRSIFVGKTSVSHFSLLIASCYLFGLGGKLDLFFLASVISFSFWTTAEITRKELEQVKLRLHFLHVLFRSKVVQRKYQCSLMVSYYSLFGHSSLVDYLAQVINAKNCPTTFYCIFQLV